MQQQNNFRGNFTENIPKKQQYKIYKTIDTESMVQDFIFDKEKLITASDIDIIFYELNEKQQKQQQIIEGAGYYLVYSICLSKSGDLFTGSHDSKIKKWIKNEDGTWLCQQVLQGHKDSVLIILLSNDERTLFSRSRDKSIKIWQQINNKWECTQTIQSNSGVLNSLSINSQSNLMSFGWKQNLSIWQLINQQKWRKYQTLGSIHKQNIESVVFILNGQQIATAAEDIKLWGIDPENELYVLFKVINTKGRVRIMNYNENSQLLYFTVSRKYVQIWKYNQQQEEFQLQQTIQAQKSDQFYEEQQNFDAIQMSEDSKYLALKDNFSDFIQIYGMV